MLQTQPITTQPTGLPVPARPNAGSRPSELTSLNWLQNISVLKDIESTPRPAEPTRGRSQNKQQQQQQQQQQQPQQHDTTTSAEQKSESKPVRKRANPDTTGKPPYSFASLIFMAIEASASKCLPVKDIYTWIVAHFPYYRSAAPAWKNSVRHNLSLNKCFKKKGEDIDGKSSKGSLWVVDPESRDILLQQLKKTGAIQAGLHRTVENSKSFWADSLKGSGYCGDDESEVIEALCGIDDEDDERVKLPPRARSCPPRLNDTTKIPSWMVKLRLSPYMAANTKGKIIRSNRVLYRTQVDGQATTTTTAAAEYERASHAAAAALSHASCAASSSAAATATSSAAHRRRRHHQACSSGEDDDERQAAYAATLTTTSNGNAFRRPDGRSFDDDSLDDAAADADDDDGGDDDARHRHAASGNPQSYARHGRHRAAGAALDGRFDDGHASAASQEEPNEEDRAAAKNLISLFNAKTAAAAAAADSPKRSRGGGGKSRARSKRRPVSRTPSDEQPKSKRARCEPAATTIVTTAETSAASSVVANANGRPVAPVQAGGRQRKQQAPRYLEGVENGAVGFRRGSRKPIRSSESAFTNVAFKAPKPRRKKSADNAAAGAALLSSPEKNGTSNGIDGLTPMECDTPVGHTGMDTNGYGAFTVLSHEGYISDGETETIILDIPPL